MELESLDSVVGDQAPGTLDSVRPPRVDTCERDEHIGVRGGCLGDLLVRDRRYAAACLPVDREDDCGHTPLAVVRGDVVDRGKGLVAAEVAPCGLAQLGRQRVVAGPGQLGRGRRRPAGQPRAQQGQLEREHDARRRPGQHRLVPPRPAAEPAQALGRAAAAARHRQRGVARLPEASQRPHVINPDQGWLANWNNVPSVGWTIGDGPDTERTIGRLHRGALPEPAGGRAARRSELRRHQGASTASPARRRSSGRCSTRSCAGRGGRRQRARQGRCSTRSWPGTATTTAPTPRARSTPASPHGRRSRTRRWRLLPARRATGSAARGGSHPFDFGARRRRGVPGADRRGSAPAGGDRAHARVRSATRRTWRQPRRMYDVTAPGVAPKPALKFYDRGTWQQAVELGP